MTRVLELNLADIVRHYHDRTGAAEAAELLDHWMEPGTARRLSMLLRDHREEPIERPIDLRRRAAVDDLLTFYGLLEIGIVAGYVPWPLPVALADRARRHLGDSRVRAYYRRFYPLDLPAMLAARLTGWRGPRGRLTRRSESLLNRFLDVSTGVEHDQAIDMFQWFLEDGYSGGYALADCYRALRSPSSYLRHLVAPPGSRSALDWAVAGIGQYLIFCRSLDELLLEAAGLPHLQRAMWCHHAYWFRSVAHDMEEVLGRIDTLVRGWSARGRKETRDAGSGLRPDARLMRLIRGAYRFRSFELNVPVAAGGATRSTANPEQKEAEVEERQLVSAGKARR